jgi:hypothetical protein
MPDGGPGFQLTYQIGSQEISYLFDTSMGSKKCF